MGIKLIADDRTNSVLVTGEQSQRLRVKALIAHLDTPREGGGDTQVIYSSTLTRKSWAASSKSKSPASSRRPGAPEHPAPLLPRRRRLHRRSQHEIWADPQTNALVISAPPKA